ncbi:hypothetical protein A4R26_11525 [Niastella populi]|uniref:Uncharacterized protein n=1 Tax=Niastella populi TaxID=550983 RepID=A0A1V9GB66_9BACT|nr:hypothetical protein A4R26_11525 [Niastella populi]
MSSSKQKPGKVTEHVSSDCTNHNQQSEVLIKFLWFYIHIKDPNPHTIEIVKRVLKFFELLVILGFTYGLVKIILLLMR